MAGYIDTSAITGCRRATTARKLRSDRPGLGEVCHLQVASVSASVVNLENQVCPHRWQ